MGDEVSLRNEINYILSSESYNDAFIDNNSIQRIKKIYQNSPFDSNNKLEKSTIYANESLKYALSRLRVTIYILNMVANESNYYNSYFQRRLKIRKESINENFNNEISKWLLEYFDTILTFTTLPKEEQII